jgi:hypothetical protein
LPYNLEVVNVVENNVLAIQRFKNPATCGGKSGLDQMPEVALSQSGTSL